MIDNIDKKIIYELNWNARQSHNKIAKKLRLSKQVVAYRIKKLEEKEIIKSYHAILDWRRLGYNSMRIYVRWKNITVEKEKKIYDFIKKDPFFMWCVKFEGDVDIGFYVWIKDIPTFARQWNKFLEKYKPYIQKYEIYESIQMINYPIKFLKKEIKQKEIIIGNGPQTKYDKTDYKILKEITKDGKIQILDLAKKIKLSAKATLQRLRKLEKNKIILGYYALIDSEKIGYHFYKIDFYLNNLKKLNSMNQYAKQHENIIYRMKTIGGPDFEIELAVKNVNDMKTIVNNIRKKYGQDITLYRIHRFEYTLKQIYLPGENIAN